MSCTESSLGVITDVPPPNRTHRADTVDGDAVSLVLATGILDLRAILRRENAGITVARPSRP